MTFSSSRVQNAGGRNLKRSLLLGTSTIALLLPSLAFAQDGPVIEEIVVTSTRRAQSVQSVPYNVSAISGTSIEDAGIGSSNELLSMVPGVFVSDVGGRNGLENNISMRGLNGNNPGENSLFQNVTEAPVSTYVNETPLFMNLLLTDIDRVEILRGPQGTLYGSGSVGGTIRYILNRPSFDARETKVGFGVGVSDQSDELNYNASAMFNFPISNRSALRIVAGYEELGGVADANGLFALNADGSAVSVNPLDPDSAPVITSSEDTDGQTAWHIRGSFLVETSDTVEVLLTYMHQEGEYDGDSVRGITDPLTGDGPEWQHDMRALSPGELDVDMGSLEVTADLGFASFTSATSQSESEGAFVNDVSGLYQFLDSSAYYYFGFPRIVAPSYITQDSSVFTQEFRLVSNSDDNWDWVVGAFYKKEEKSTSFRDMLPGYDAWGLDPASFGSFLAFTYYGLTTLDEFYDVILGATRPDPAYIDVPYAQDRDIEFEDIAIFGEATYHFTDQFQITAGVRVFWQEFSQDNTIRFPYCGPFCATSADPTDAALGTSIVQSDADFDDQIFKINTSYEINDDTMVYATWSEGFRHGGANAFPTAGAFAFDPALIPFKPDEVTNYEAGVKGYLYDGRVQYTVAAFLMQWDDIQLDTFLGPLSVPSVVNGEEAESRGLEVEAKIRPADGLTLGLGYSFIDAELTKDSALIGAFEGDPLPGVSEHTLSLLADYYQTLKDGNSVHYHLNVAHRSDFATTFNAATGNYAELEGFTILNGSITFELETWSIGAHVKNITNEDGVTGLVNNRHALVPEDSRAFVRRPRTFGISTSFKF